MDPDKYKLINKENLQSLQFKYSLAQHLVDAVHDLVVLRHSNEISKAIFKNYIKYEQT